MTDTDRHGRKSNNPVWEGDVHADCSALETVLAAQLAAARTVTQRLLDGWEPLGGQWRNESEVDIDGVAIRTPMSDAERAWLAGTTKPADDNTP